MKIINICICSCKRQKSLENCLLKLREIEIPPDVTILVSIVDNDPERSAEQVYYNISEHPHLSFYYFHESRRGIPFARNRAISESFSLNADVIVFIDDDEWPKTDWLLQLYTYYEKAETEKIVSGHVISDLPDNVSHDISALFNKKAKKTGSQLSSCATNNVLIPAKIILESGIRFDETNPLAGGTDTIFFCQLVEQGYLIEKCSEAVVHEIIPESRLSIKWMARRKYRAGITVAWRKLHGGRSRFSVSISSIFQIISCAIKFLIYSLILKKLKRNESLLIIARACGTLSGIMGTQVESYQKVDGE